MDQKEFVREQYLALREEINATKWKLFITIVLGVVFVPLLIFIAAQPSGEYVGPALPFVVMILTVLYLAEEQALMRCGRFIREKVEPALQPDGGWEEWLEDNPNLRFMDKCVFAVFFLVFLAFYLVTAGQAINELWQSKYYDALDVNTQAMLGGLLYTIGALWLLITFLTHWGSATRTSQ